MDRFMNPIRSTQSPKRSQTPRGPGGTVYSVHAPYLTTVLSRTSISEDQSLEPKRQHAIIADGAYLDEPQANSWMATGTIACEPDPSPWSTKKVMVQIENGTWEAREQTPESVCEEHGGEEEVLLLDEDVLERDFDTGMIGECGLMGCKKGIGCVYCRGHSPFIRPSPRTTFREDVARGDKASLLDTVQLQQRTNSDLGSRPPLLSAEKGYPKHLQRLVAPTEVIDVEPMSNPNPASSQIHAAAALVAERKTGPKIKYIRKRPLPSPEQSTGREKKKKKMHNRREK